MQFTQRKSSGVTSQVHFFANAAAAAAAGFFISCTLCKNCVKMQKVCKKYTTTNKMPFYKGRAWDNTKVKRASKLQLRLRVSPVRNDNQPGSG